MKKTLFTIVASIIFLNVLEVYGGLNKNNFSAEENAKIVYIIENSAKLGLFSDILYKRVNEGVARKAPFERVYAVAQQKIEEMGRLKDFCDSSGNNGLVVEWSRKNAQLLLNIIQGGLEIDDILFYHRSISGLGVSAADFFEVLKFISGSIKNGHPSGFLKDSALIFYELKTDASYVYDYFRLTSRLRAKNDFDYPAILSALKGSKDFNYIENLFGILQPGSDFGREGRELGDELKQRIHRGNSESGNDAKGRK